MSNNESRNNLLATLILIIVIVMLIYFLTRSKDYNSHDSENITNNDLNKVVEDNHIHHTKQHPKHPHKKVSFQTDDTIHEFAPNDNNDHHVGADISNAYDNPLPPEERIDVIDLNKNNVKNYNAKDYLPKEIIEEWFDTDFSQAKYNINDDNLINTERYIIGINTVGQSLKNASYDIRGTVANPKFSISPWNNSTIEPDYNIKSLC